MVRLTRKERLNYDDFLYVCQQVRKKLGLRRPERQQKLPQLLPATVLTRFFQVIEECGDVQHEIMLKLLFYTAIRVSGLIRIETTDVDLDHCKIFIDRGKGNKDGVVSPNPRKFRHPNSSPATIASRSMSCPSPRNV